MKKEMNLMKKLEFDDIIIYTMRLYKKHFFYFIKILAVYFVPATILMTLFYIGMLDNYNELFSSIQNIENQSSFFPLGTIFSIYKKLFLMVIIYLMLFTLAEVALVKGINEKIMGRDIPAIQMIKASLKKIIPVLITSLISFIMFGAGIMCCIIPVIILAVYMRFIPQIMMIENKFYFTSIGRSFSLVNNYFWSTFLILIVYFFFYFFLSAIISYGLQVFPFIKIIKSIIQNKGQTDPEFMMDFFKNYTYIYIIQMVLTNLLSLLLTPIVIIALTLKFLNIRNLKEGTSLLDEIKKEQVETS